MLQKSLVALRHDPTQASIFERSAGRASPAPAPLARTSSSWRAALHRSSQPASEWSQACSTTAALLPLRSAAIAIPPTAATAAPIAIAATVRLRVTGTGRRPSLPSRVAMRSNRSSGSRSRPRSSAAWTVGGTPGSAGACTLRPVSSSRSHSEIVSPW